MKEIIDNLEFEPVIAFSKCGNQIQRCRTKYKGIYIQWETFFHWNIFKDPTDSFLVDRIVKSDSLIKNGFVNENYYTAEGYGFPQFEKLEDAILYINNI